MTIEQKNIGSVSKEQHVFDLSKKEYLYRMVFYTNISPRMLEEELIIKLDRPEPMTQEEKRTAKIAELDAYKNACLRAYNELCDLGVMHFDLQYLMENGFGMGAGDGLDDEDIDRLVMKDEEIENRKKLE